MHAANGYFMWFNMAITIWFAFNMAKYGKKTWQKTCKKKPCFHVVQPRWVDLRNILGNFMITLSWASGCWWGRFRIVQPKKRLKSSTRVWFNQR
jgi:hypothetical protein